MPQCAWTNEQDAALREGYENVKDSKGRPAWGVIVKQNPVLEGRSAQEARCRWKRMQWKGEAKNKCRRCGAPRRGHTCAFEDPDIIPHVVSPLQKPPVVLAQVVPPVLDRENSGALSNKNDRALENPHSFNTSLHSILGSANFLEITGLRQTSESQVNSVNFGLNVQQMLGLVSPNNSMLGLERNDSGSGDAASGLCALSGSGDLRAAIPPVPSVLRAVSNTSDTLNGLVSLCGELAEAHGDDAPTVFRRAPTPDAATDFASRTCVLESSDGEKHFMLG